jgi:hypothetical protein
MDARELFLADHIQTHSVAVEPSAFENGELLSLAALRLRGVSDEILRTAPEGLQSVAWILWHLARNEDVVVNGLLRNGIPVMERDGWAERMGIAVTHIGTGDGPEEIALLNASVDVGALMEYRNAVGRETRQWVRTIDWSELDRRYPGGEVGRTFGAFGPKAGWLADLWSSKSGYWLLSFGSTGHNLLHLGEADMILGVLGRRNY